MTVQPNWDIVFLITGKPLPAMLDMAHFAQNAGRRALMIVLERGEQDLVIDRAMINFEIVTIEVPYKGVEFKRLTSLVSVYRRIRAIISNGLADDGLLVTSSYDLLMLGTLIALGRRYRLRHQVRDLHALQLSGSIISRVLVWLERLMLRRVESVIVSSEAFATRYYRRIFRGRIVVLENTPSRTTWANFRKELDNDGVFRIGYIGIIRYRRSLEQLIAAIRQLARSGYRLKVVFAGGGSVGTLVDDDRERDLFEFLGPYEYTRDIKRLYSNIDLIYAVYDSFDLNCQVAMPNKFYEALLARIPIIVAERTFVAQEVEREGIGAAVLTGDADRLAELLREAVERRGWYERATHRLVKASTEPYHAAYEAAMRASVLP